MQSISRAEAKAAGLKRYFTGEPCPHGHVSERRVSDFGCTECSRLKARSPKERARRREYFRDHQRRYRANHPDRIKATESRRDKEKRAAVLREKRSLHPERHRAILRRSFQNHKAKRMAETAAWKRANPLATSIYSRTTKAKRRAAEGSYTCEDIDRLLKKQNGHCVGCGCNIAAGYHVDHIVPLTRGGTNWPDNLQLMCGPCNQSKGNKMMWEWLAWQVVVLLTSRARTRRR